MSIDICWHMLGALSLKGICTAHSARQTMPEYQHRVWPIFSLLTGITFNTILQKGFMPRILVCCCSNTIELVEQQMYKNDHNKVFNSNTFLHMASDPLVGIGSSSGFFLNKRCCCDHGRSNLCRCTIRGVGLFHNELFSQLCMIYHTDTLSWFNVGPI